MTPEQSEIILEQLNLSMLAELQRIGNVVDVHIEQVNSRNASSLERLHTVTNDVARPLDDLKRATHKLEKELMFFKRETRALLATYELLSRLKQFKPLTKKIQKGDLEALAIASQIENITNILNVMGPLAPHDSRYFSQSDDNDTAEQGDEE
jgi:archaellum component FlaC